MGGGFTMKFTDLMIGDWVLANGSPYKIESINNMNEYCARGKYNVLYVGHAKYIKGVPLTPEILEKNGWEYKSELFMEKVNENIHLNWTGRYGAALYKNNYHMCDCNYVHTLQHALRLCGLDELADNFKL